MRLLLALFCLFMASAPRADGLQDRWDTAWESLWFQGGSPTNVVRWNGDIRVRIDGLNRSFHRQRILDALGLVAGVAGRKVIDVTDDADAQARANLEVQIVDNLRVPDNLACSVRFEKVAQWTIEKAVLKMREGAVYRCVLHEAMHVMGISGHPAGDTVLSYFYQRHDAVTELDRLMLRAWYSPAMRPGMTPFEALVVLSQAVLAAEQGAAPDADMRRRRFLEATVRDMEAFAGGKGDVPLILKRSGTASEEVIRSGQTRIRYFLGLAYLRGTIVARDPAAAIAWFERAGRDGLAVAQFTLGHLFDTGEGVAPNGTSAYVWYGLAAAQNILQASAAMARIADQLTPEQLADAKTRLTAFK